MKVALFVFSLLLGGCVTSRVPEKKGKYPEFFTAQQTLRFQQQDRDDTLLAQLNFAKEDIGLLMVHPLFGSPLVKISMRDKVVEEKWFVDKQPIPVKEVLDSIVTIYRTPNIELGRPYPLTHGRFVITSHQYFSGCFFPSEIRLIFHNNMKLRVVTTEVECD